MFEIEIKAHVYDYNTTEAKLNSIATYQGKTEKQDTYWHFATPGKTNAQGRPYISVRIRKEQTDDDTKVFLTYKRKELKQRADGTTFEVNDEQETLIADATPLELLLSDTGYVPAVKKQKRVQGWIYDTPHGQAHIELCTVPPLGDFIEIEILSASNEKETVATIHKQLCDILALCDIPQSQIEPRFYTDMLKEATQEKY